MTNPRPWRLNAPRRRNQRTPMSWIDKRYRSGQELADVYNILSEHITERCGRPPNGIEKIHISRALAIKRHLIPFDAKEMLEPNDLEHYVRLNNAFQRELDKLGMSEEVDIARQRAEASILNAYAK